MEELRRGHVLDRPAVVGIDALETNACFWVEASWNLYAKGYRIAAESMFERVSSEGRHMDSTVYPLVFLWRQYLELRLKQAILTGHGILNEGERADLLLTHSLSKLWRKAEPILCKVVPEANEETAAASEIIAQFDALDPDSMAFRYPVSRDGHATVPRRSNLCLQNFDCVMRQLARYLDDVTSYFDHVEGELLALAHDNR